MYVRQVHTSPLPPFCKSRFFCIVIQLLILRCVRFFCFYLLWHRIDKHSISNKEHITNRGRRKCHLQIGISIEIIWVMCNWGHVPVTASPKRSPLHVSGGGDGTLLTLSSNSKTFRKKNGAENYRRLRTVQ